jgi:macrolide transport system ATP-binding/permease protein
MSLIHPEDSTKVTTPPTDVAPVILETQGLVFSYVKDSSHPPILKGLNLQIRKGELVAIQGPSGSGKSTLLYLLGLLTKPDLGSVKMFGQDVSEIDEDALAKLRNQNIGFVFQQFHLLARTSVLDNVLLPAQYKNFSIAAELTAEQTERAKYFLEYVGLSHRLNHQPNQLSGGQQQRVAICRSLINDPEVILADEPTGNLDSQSAEQILNLLKDLNRRLNKTIVIITHDNDVANKCDRIIHIKDGLVANVEVSNSIKSESSPLLEFHSAIDQDKIDFSSPTATQPVMTNSALKKKKWMPLLQMLKNSLPQSIQNLKTNKMRTALTMLGISVGVAAVLSMVSIGKFTKQKVLEGYSALGINTLAFQGYRNWQMKATDKVPVPFQSFVWERDLKPLKQIFPEIKLISPTMWGWDAKASFGGRRVEQEVRVLGINEDYFSISQMRPVMGRTLTTNDVQKTKSVCVIGYEIAAQLAKNTSPIGKVFGITMDESNFGCTVVGVLPQVPRGKYFNDPNLRVHIPFTYFQAMASNFWMTRIEEFSMHVDQNFDVEKTGRGIKNYFEKRYGSSGRFRADSDTVLISQMRQFLTLFAVLLGMIALVTLAVGGMGITNMMLVSVSERFREIGLRKALGATHNQIRTQFLTESMVICALAGAVGLVAGWIACNGAIWFGAQLIEKMKFEFVFDVPAFLLSFVSIFIVGFLSGLFPALKAEKLTVIEALRSE